MLHLLNNKIPSRYLCSVALFILALNFCLNTLTAQDVHFTQAHNTILYFNPAYTSNFDGKYKMGIQYKNQWRNISNTYKTVYASAEMMVFKKKKTGNFLGVGLILYNDKAGKAGLQTLQLMPSLAYNLRINRTNYLAFGFAAGYLQKSINLNNLKWDSQYNGFNYDATLPNQENINYTNVKAFDCSVGLNWNVVPYDENKLSFGIAASHVNLPNISNYQNTYNPLPIKYTAYFTGNINGNDFSLIPLVMYNRQITHNELVIGSLFNFNLGLNARYTNLNKSSKIGFGLIYRLNDALCPTIQLEFKKQIKLSFCYDFTLNKLKQSNKTLGGSEVYIGYIN